MRGIAFGAIFFVGCAHDGSWEVHAALRRAETELACPQSTLTGEYIGGGGVMVRGCGLTRSYTCRGRLCVPDGAATGEHTAIVASPNFDAPPTEDQRTARDALAGCTVAPGEHVVFYVGVEGDVLRVEAPDVPPGARACVEHALMPLAFAPRGDADRIEIAIPSPVAQVAPVVQVATPGSSMRAMVAARRDSILLCNGGAATAVVAEWTAEGAVTLHLPDARAGSAEDGCVRATADGARIEPAPGTAGSLLQAVQ